ncbi:SIS domain-containing protein [Candidatus Woesearchaeota archaeon]|nr:SIS domain-containing protein [Candidatus Woesearchaeota archaeon]
MTLLDNYYTESRDAVAFSKKYVTYLSEILKSLDHKTIAKIIDHFLEAKNNQKTIYFMGNGGSAATATHFACDLGKGTKTGQHKFKTQALADNLATFTAYANDEGYEYVFSKQLENVLQKGDIVVALSASGNSQNLINAIVYAKTRGALTISLLGFDGGKLKDISDVALVVHTNKGEYGPVEDVHLVLDHLITSFLYRKLSQLK